MFKYYLLHKPFGFLSQFSKDHPNQKTLADLMPDIDKDVYPLGRLDKDSEGLLLLTSNRRLNQRLLHPNQKHLRTYHLQVEGAPTKEDLSPLLAGVMFRAKKKSHLGKFHSIEHLQPYPYADRKPPIRFRKDIPETGLRVTLEEGKNRQVRKMMAAIGFPVLRLIRYSIEEITIQDLPLGHHKEVSESFFLSKLKLD